KNLELCWHNQTKREINPFMTIPELKDFWATPESRSDSWKAPDGMFWICGKRAYHTLAKKWRGTCTIGIIQPDFFLLPKSRENTLGVPL
ncbi:ENR1 protein, partial [Eudromia elegans]|nr:ENR1 protein [Eudromia elegans]